MSTPLGADLRWGSGPQEGAAPSQPHARPSLGTRCERLIQANLCSGSQIRPRLGEKGVCLEAGHLGSGYAQGQRSVGRDTKFGVGKVVKELQPLLSFERWTPFPHGQPRPLESPVGLPHGGLVLCHQVAAVSWEPELLLQRR